jgi:hypothetical protein
MFKRTSRTPKDAQPAEAPAKPAEPPVKPAEPQVYRKPRADIYTVVLSVALIAAAIAAAALWMTMGDYHYEIKGGPTPVWNHPAAPAAFDGQSAVV